MHIATLTFGDFNPYSLTKKLVQFTNFECFNLGTQWGREEFFPPPSLLISLGLPV